MVTYYYYFPCYSIEYNKHMRLCGSSFMYAIYLLIEGIYLLINQ